jgi:hypothetical protein
MRFFTLLFAVLAWSSQAGAIVVWDDSFKLQEMDEVAVVSMDFAEGACWTNLKEVREYAEEKLRFKGANVIANPNAATELEGYYAFTIYVKGNRLYSDGSGPCVGLISIQLATPVFHRGRRHFAVIASVMGDFRSKSNFNRDVIEGISKLLAKLN